MGKDYKDDWEDDKDFAKYMAMKWGTPKGLVSIVTAFAIFLTSIGLFILLLHLSGLF